MNYRSTDENRNSPGVLGEAAQRQRKECVSGAKADHHKSNTMDSERTCDEGLRITNKKYSVMTVAKHMRYREDEGGNL